MKTKIGRKSAEQSNKLLESIHYQQISFEQAKKIVRNFDHPSWSEDIETIIQSSGDRSKEKPDRSAKDILDQMINQQKKSNQCYSGRNSSDNG